MECVEDTEIPTTMPNAQIFIHQIILCCLLDLLKINNCVHIIDLCHDALCCQSLKKKICFKINLNNHEKQNQVLCMCVNMNIIDGHMYCTHSPLQCSHGYHGEYVCYGVEPKQQLLHLEPKNPKILWSMKV